MNDMNQLGPREKSLLERMIQQHGDLEGKSLFAYEHHNIELLPEGGEEFLIKHYVSKIESLEGIDLSSFTHHGCHYFEDGSMAQEAYRKIGDAILDKLIEKAEQGLNAHANRSIAGYWESVKDNPEAQEGLKAILEKHPNYAFAQKYLGYMNGEKPDDTETLKERYLQDRNMLFVTTPLVDVDGTLIKDGKINDLLIFELMNCEYKCGKIAIYTGGKPKSQKEVLLKAVAENILEKHPSLSDTYSVDNILEICSRNNEQSKSQQQNLRHAMLQDYMHLFQIKLNSIQSDKERNYFKYQKDQWIYQKYAVDEALVKFIQRLENRENDQIKIYPKQAFVQENVCLAGIVVDDTQPQAQEIKSLSMAVLTPQESTLFINSSTYVGGERLDVPEERKITAEQVVEMYNMSKQISQKLQKLREKSPTGKLEDVPHLATQVLRAVGEDNLGKPKRSKAEKEIIKSAINKAMQDTKN